MKIVFYHNPRCSKSRAVHALLQQRELPFDLVEYLKAPLTESDLNGLIDALDQPAHALLRTGESDFKNLQLNPDELSRDSVVQILLKNPVWFQRPVVLVGDRARIGRPIENIESILP